MCVRNCVIFPVKKALPGRGAERSDMKQEDKIMKLLLVDDEEYSRDGILSVVSWKSLGIDEIKIAENGNEGLKTALEFQPDIVLADIRMPHMDGMTMCSRIREKLPYCSFIIISGYSDKEYLKSAIRLSAVNYLEKPFLPRELTESLKQAIARRSAYISSGVYPSPNMPSPDLENRMALALLHPHPQSDPLWNQIHEHFPDLPEDARWITLLITIHERADHRGIAGPEHQKEIFSLLRRHLDPGQDTCLLLGAKSENVTVAHIAFRGGTDISIRMGSLQRELADCLKNRCHYTIGEGASVSGIHNVHSSYETAMLCIQQGFFRGPDCVIAYQPVENPPVYSFSQEAAERFAQLIKGNDIQAVEAFIHTLSGELKSYDYTLISSVKDFFSQLIRKLYYHSDSFLLPAFSMEETLADSIQIIWDVPYLSNLEQYMCRRVSALFRELEKGSNRLQDNPLPCKIKNYIDSNYCDPNLCLQSLSDAFNITTSYICIIFKKQYQKTINQYINEKRIEKSMEYLEQSDKKIKEISSLIGFPDANYFIKVFKKVTGTTPKEYRRK